MVQTDDRGCSVHERRQARTDWLAVNREGTIVGRALQWHEWLHSTLPQGRRLCATPGDPGCASEASAKPLRLFRAFLSERLNGGKRVAELVQRWRNACTETFLSVELSSLCPFVYVVATEETMTILLIARDHHTFHYYLPPAHASHVVNK